MKTRLGTVKSVKKTLNNEIPRSFKQSWRTIGGKRKYFRSKWEANFARYLEFLKKYGHIKDWDHEPQTFWFLQIKRGTRSYLPDFKVTENDGSHNWIEVKGYFDQKSNTKIKRFRKYYPQEKFRLVNSEWFKKHNKKMKCLIKDWE
jgi:hypothetical protein